MTNKTKYYWKVVRNKDGKYVSCIIKRGRYKVTYKVGQYVSATIKENGLFVFKTRKNAREFAAPTEMIFKVKVRGEQIFNPNIYRTDDLEDNIKNPICLTLPEGTCHFPEVMLVKQSR